MDALRQHDLLALAAMCGRFTLTSEGDIVAEFIEEFGVGPDVFAEVGELAPRYNIAPTQATPVITNRKRAACSIMNWGLVPNWASDPSIGSRMINARSESLSEKPSFREAYRSRRCIVPTSGFYEWERTANGRTQTKPPFYFRRRDHKLFAFAGLWERWRKPDGDWLASYTIITRPAIEFLHHLHHRMPVIIAKRDIERWLCEKPVPNSALRDIFEVDIDVADFELYQVGKYVNRASNDDPTCIAPHREAQQSLFS